MRLGCPKAIPDMGLGNDSIVQLLEIAFFLQGGIQRINLKVLHGLIKVWCTV